MCVCVFVCVCVCVCVSVCVSQKCAYLVVRGWAAGKAVEYDSCVRLLLDCCVGAEGRREVLVLANRRERASWKESC